MNSDPVTRQNPFDDRLRENVARVRERIVAATERCGRALSEITLIAVTKYVGHEEVRALVAAGCFDLGESRPQALWEKRPQLPDQIQWHLIGHLQRNKVRRTLPIVASIDSVDSVRLAGAIDTEAAHLPRRMPILLEVNTSGDASKHGFAADALQDALPRLAAYKHLEVRGLMTIAAREGGLPAARKNFSQLRQLRDRLQTRCPAGVRLNELSMGMSRDLEVAIEEGATQVRVGSALFEGVR
ncbi:MAG: YggS family pyridoxal phosphate-dependent enzyme [Pirellulales bacterium]